MSDPSKIAAWSRLISLIDSGHWDVALETFRETTGATDPDAGMWRRLGYELGTRNALDASVKCLERARSLAPNDPELLSDLGAALGRSGRIDDAIAAYTAANEFAPNRVPTLSALGALSTRAGRLDQANHWFGLASRIAPDDSVVLNNFGATLLANGVYAEAVVVLKKAVSIQPDFAEACLNLGVALQRSEDFSGAIDAYNRAIATGAPPAVVSFNVATLHEARGDFSRAIRHLDRAIAQNPNYADARRNRGLLHLMAGQWAQAWDDYEWRWQCADLSRHKRLFPQPWWNGRNATTSVLLWGEQGIGDEVLYSSLARQISGQGLRVVLEVDPRLVRLLSRGMPSVHVIGRTPTPNPAITSATLDAQISLGSVPGILNMTAAMIAESWMPHLRADPSAIQHFAGRFRAASRRPTFCLSWRSFNPHFGANKSIPIDDIAQLINSVDAQWIDVQYGDVGQDRERLVQDAGPIVRTVQDIDLQNDLDSLAAILASSDMVVTASNVVAHLAGALGIQCWVLVPANSAKLWYWGTEGDGCPWYPSVRLFRQVAPGSWREPIGRLIADLRHFVEIYRMDISLDSMPGLPSS